MRLAMAKCRMNLMILWLSGSLVFLLIIWLQVALGHYGSNGREAFEWFIPVVTPTLSLVVGVWAQSAIKTQKESVLIGKRVYSIAVIVSGVYFGFILLTILIEPFVAKAPIDFLKESSLVFGILQGVVTAVMGIFFSQKEQE